MRVIIRDTVYVCTDCNDYFHVDYFSILHVCGVLKEINAVLDKVIGSNENIKKFLIKNGKKRTFDSTRYERNMINSIKEVVLSSAT